MLHDGILILDFGSQVTQLIARRLREAHVYTEILPFSTDPARIRAANPRGIILSGGPASVHQDVAPRAPDCVFELGVPVLGICYGQQSICQQLGGRVEPSDHREFGHANIDVVADSALFQGFWQTGKQYQVWMSHGDRVTALPSGFQVIATSEGAPYAAIANEAKKYYGVQFHPEVVHTPEGKLLLRQFALGICGLEGNWTMHGYRAEAVAKIRAQVGSGKVICAVSGGVDSSVAALLLHEAIGDQLHCIFIDHGLLRENEAENVKKFFADHFKVPLLAIDASQYFLSRLEGVGDPEAKRKIIGETFINVFENEAKEIGDVAFLAQGTLYPDVIESVSFSGGPSVTIKSHHNVGGLPEKMNLKLVEPLRELFKDEVRALARELEMPEAWLGRHPFPGPGLAIRIPGEVTPAKLAILRKADAIYLEEIRNAGFYDDIWQALAVLLPVRSVGVMGDSRSYDYALSIRAVTATDGMTAESFEFPHAFLKRVMTRIINEVRGINRVLYDITSKPPGTIEWE